MKNKPPKMTEVQKKEQHRGSRFIKVIPAPEYARWRRGQGSQHVFDDQGRRVK